jgi:3-oxoacyl-[acyl-carrier protein] reductase
MSNTIRSALVGWSKSLSNEVASAGITVNMLLPGRIRTDRLKQLDAAAAERSGKSVEEVSAAEQALIPAGRYGTVEDFGNVGAFLCSEAASYMTGGLIRCDGGSIRGV